MSRLVQARPINQAHGAGGDGFLDRVAKYIPAEIVAAYLAIQSLVLGLAPDAPRFAVLLGVLIVLMVVTPVYLWRTAKADGSPWKLQAGIAVIALPLWAYALVALPEELDIYNGTVAAIALILFSVVVGAFQPAAPTTSPATTSGAGATG